jgi:poly-beta-1,6-N-acetyl-D-glucosamine synthase
MFFWLSLFVALTAYGVVILISVFGWLSIHKYEVNDRQAEETYISLIIAIRNEESNLPGLIKSLEKIRYGIDHFEILFINDHSEDDSSNIIREYAREHHHVRIFELPDGQHGKKAAILLGIQCAKGELCLLTDADCVFHPDWLHQFCQAYQRGQKPDMLIGLVDYYFCNSLLKKVFRLEFLSLIITGAGLAAMNFPVYCNGANLALKRSELLDPVDLKPAIASGDDVFMLHEFFARHKRIQVVRSYESIVYTKPPDNIKDFFLQRIRWGSKAKDYTNPFALMLAGLVFLSSVFLLVGLFISIFGFSFRFFVFAFFLKTLIDFLSFLSGAKFFRIYPYLFLIPIIELFYPFYIVAASFSGIKKPFRWKGRKVR